MFGWLGTIIQGVLLGGLYALFAAGLSLIFGIMRLVNLAHGDLIVLAAFVILALASWFGIDPFLAALFAMPAMFAAGFALQYFLLNRTLGPRPAAAAAGDIRAVDHHPERVAEAFSADSRRLRLGAVETASIAARRRIGDRRDAAAHAALRDRRDPGAQPPVLSDRRWAVPSAPPPTISRSRS